MAIETDALPRQVETRPPVDFGDPFMDRNANAALSSYRSTSADIAWLPDIAVGDDSQGDAAPNANGGDNLRQVLDSQMSGPENAERRERFLQDMQTFELRARSRGLSNEEINQTYGHIERLLSAGTDARIPHDQRIALASQVMRNAADPTGIRQNENTCGVTSLESLIYSRHPAAAARLVTDVATTGSYTGTNGTTVTLDAESLRPSDAVGTVNLSREGEARSFASQLFQVTAANVANRQEPNREHFVYAQLQPEGPKDTGEALYDTSVDPPEIIAHEPGATGHINGLIGTYESITGDTDVSGFMMNRAHIARRSSRADGFANAEELGQRLEQLDRAGRLPALMTVHATNRLFDVPGQSPPPEQDASEQNSGNNDRHYITVTGYDPATRTVFYDNNYGREEDRTQRGVPLDAFYDATLNPR